MPLYSYTVLNERKERVQGMVDAISLQAGRSALQESGLFVEEIHEATPLERDAVKPWETEAVIDRESCQLSASSFQEVPDGTSERAALPHDPGLGEEQNLKAESYNLTPAYHPLLDTLRLYAGWLLAWYILVMSLGAYQETKSLPFTIPFVEGLWQSVLIIRAAFGVFLFLMLTSLYRFFGGRGWVGAGLGGLGVFVFYAFLVNT